MENIPFTFEVVATKDNEKISFDVQTKCLAGGNDCKIGNFYRNFWFRTNKALKKDFAGYGELKNWHKAVKLSLLKRGFSEISFS